MSAASCDQRHTSTSVTRHTRTRHMRHTRTRDMRHATERDMRHETWDSWHIYGRCASLSYHESTTHLLLIYYSCTTHLLLLYYSSTTHVLLIHYSCTTHLLLMYYSSTTHLLLMYYSCTTSGMSVRETWLNYIWHAVATVGRIDNMIGLVGRISSLLEGSFSKETNTSYRSD